MSRRQPFLKVMKDLNNKKRWEIKDEIYLIDLYGFYDINIEGNIVSTTGDPEFSKLLSYLIIRKIKTL